MAVTRGKLEFQNVIVMHTRSIYGKWQEQAMQLRSFIVKNNLFITGPVMVRWGEIEEETKEADLTIYLPTFQKLQMPENNTFSYQETFLLEDGLKIRQTSANDDCNATEALLAVMAEKADLKLQKPYYYIYLPVFGEYVIDIYAPIEKGAKP